MLGEGEKPGSWQKMVPWAQQVGEEVADHGWGRGGGGVGAGWGEVGTKLKALRSHPWSARGGSTCQS